MDDDTYLRNRSRESIFHLIRALRALQKVNNFPDSQIFQTILNVWKLDEGGSFIKLHLEYMIDELRRNEKHEARIKRHFKKE